MTTKPSFRKIRGYAFDPSLSMNIDTALINHITYKIPWEDDLQLGPSGEYLEVVDYDPTVKKWYSPVNLNDLYIVAQDGLDPSGGNPQFHQQMVYAVAMTTIKNFEVALGRPVLWSPRRVNREEPPKQNNKLNAEKEKSKEERDSPRPTDKYVPKLRIYPHAMREANAYYSPQKKALLFGYFSARPADVTLQMPANLTFSCLSHDIIAHETTHAILDGLYRKYIEDTNPDVLAFHEAFADIVALFQHFTFPDVLKNQIGATRGDLTAQNLLGKLAQEFGIATGSYGSMRDAIGEIDPVTKKWKRKEPNGEEYRTIKEPHARGAILVSAVFDAFLTMYKSRVADLLRIATNGTGVLPQGQLQPDLVNRLAAEASKTAGHVLRMCIRALDFCPPVDINFGDFLRAVITADADLVEDDVHEYRISFIDAFRNRGIYPTGIKNLSVESLTYSKPDFTGMDEQLEILSKFLREYRQAITYEKNREEIFNWGRDYMGGKYNVPEEDKIIGLHRRLHVKFNNSIDFEKLTGLVFSDNYRRLGIHPSHAYNSIDPRPSFEVHSLHFAARVGPNGNQSNQVIVTLIQRSWITITTDKNGDKQVQAGTANKGFEVTGGCTLLFDLDSMQLKYAISKPLIDVDLLRTSGQHEFNKNRLMQIDEYQNRLNVPTFQAYFGIKGSNLTSTEPFCFLHTH